MLMRRFAALAPWSGPSKTGVCSDFNGISVGIDGFDNVCVLMPFFFVDCNGWYLGSLAPGSSIAFRAGLYTPGDLSEA